MSKKKMIYFSQINLDQYIFSTFLNNNMRSRLLHFIDNLFRKKNITYEINLH